MTWDRVERLIGAGNLAHLAGKTVAVIGCGSGGGFAALTLAMSGVGGFVLIDDDVLEETNVMRHVADRRFLGQPKAEAVAALIRQRVGHTRITTHIGRLENHLDALDSVDLVVSGIDNEPSKYILNEACLKRGITAVYAGVYERGEGGDVVIVRPYQAACYACWAAQLREDLGTVRTNEAGELDYGMIGKEGTLEAEPGLWLHVTRIAGTQADIALNELLRATPIYRELPGTTVILANTALEILEGHTSLPYSAVWTTIPRDPACLVCGGGRRLDDEAADDMPFSIDDMFRAAGLQLEENQDE
ncbi:MAG: ThiF family adenylyltransferase [bacterium]|nr:ThiF family adenylyltransferase [bacterium]